MNSGVYAGIFAHSIMAMKWSYLTAKWYTPLIFAFLVAPIQYWALTEWGIISTLTVDFFRYLGWTMLLILFAGMAGYAAISYGFDCSPIIPLPGFGDRFRSSSIMIANLLALLVFDAIWIVFYYHQRLLNYNWAIIGAWIMANFVLFLQYIITYYSAKNQEQIGDLPELTPFRYIENVNGVFLLFSVVINILFISIIISVNSYPASSFAEVWGSYIGVGVDIIVIIAWIIKLNMNAKQNN